MLDRPLSGRKGLITFAVQSVGFWPCSVIQEFDIDERMEVSFLNRYIEKSRNISQDGIVAVGR